MSLLIGVKAFILIQLPIITVAGIFGFWLFYVQHQFDPTYWSRSDSWDYKRVALEGSSFFKLPRILQYFSGNIGFHHIHHLSPLIPNYNLSRCHRENPLFNEIKPLTFWRSFKTLTFRLWNEQTKEMVSFRKLKYIRLWSESCEEEVNLLHCTQSANYLSGRGLIFFRSNNDDTGCMEESDQNAIPTLKRSIWLYDIVGRV